MEFDNLAEQTDSERWKTLLEAQQANTEAIQKLTEATSGMVQVRETALALQKFVKWSSVFLVIAGVLAAMIKSVFFKLAET